MKALTVRQPFATLIARGHKTVENRGWYTSFRGPFLVHASKTLTRREFSRAVHYLWDYVPGGQELVEELGPFEQMQRGCIVGVADLVGCRRSPDDPRQCARFETSGGYALMLGAAAELPPVPCKGTLGFWDVPPEAVADTGLRVLTQIPRGWRGQSVSCREQDRRLRRLVEWRDGEPGEDHMWYSRPTDLGDKVRAALLRDSHGA